MIRLLLAAGVALGVSVLLSGWLIRFFTRHGIGQPIRDDGPEGHHTKAGTPTMGGVAIVIGALVGYVTSDLYRGIYTRTGIIAMMAIVAGGAVGMMDDWIKVRDERNLGLNKRAKVIGMLVVAVGFAVALVSFTNVHTELAATRFDSIGLDLGRAGWIVWAVLLVLGSSNAVNLTDGLDGLAAGSALFSFAAFCVIAYWQFRHTGVYEVSHALDVAVVAASMIGGCAGFLWYNAAPAQIIMGDTGSLALGTGLASLALATNTHLLLPIIGGLFVVETVSVIIQVGSFRTRGRRVFRMAPIHHHFELGGWPETTVIVRFWMMHGLCVAVGLGLFYADAIDQGLSG